MASSRKRSAKGHPQIKKKITKSGGKEYEYWTTSYTVGYDHVTGKQMQKKITGKTQREVADKLSAALADLKKGTYVEPSKLTVGQWLDIWIEEYSIDLKPATLSSYQGIIRTHILPELSGIKLDELTPHRVQTFMNTLSKPTKARKALSPKTVKNVYGVMNASMKQALKNKYIHSNPVEGCKLPRIEKKQLKPMDEEMISKFLKEIHGHRFEALYITALFTGMRESELLGLKYAQVDLEAATITIDKQLRKVRSSGSEYKLDTTKTGNVRTIAIPPYLVDVLQKVKLKQIQNKLKLGDEYVDSGFVFTDDFGEHLKHITVYKNFKQICAKIGTPETRFHDLRHSYAMLAIKGGDSMKTVSENMGHSQIGTTMNIYSFVSPQMKRDSANRMENTIHSVSA